jgi:hypothetical protein
MPEYSIYGIMCCCASVHKFHGNKIITQKQTTCMSPNFISLRLNMCHNVAKKT